VVPVYNGEKFVAEALTSVLAQTVADMEIIVIDDGSTDDTRQVVGGFGTRVNYRYQPNAGADHAYNHGISLARGEFVAFLDHDDRWLPNKIDSQLAILSRHPEVGLTYCEVECIDEQGVVVPRKTWAQRRGVRQDLIGDTATLLRRRMPVSVPAAMMFRRDLLERIGGFDCNLPRGGGHADGKLCILAGETAKVYFALQPLVQYRVHAHQMTHGRRQALHQFRIHSLDSLWTRWRDRPEYRGLLLPLYGRYWSKEGRRAFDNGEIETARRCLKAALRCRPLYMRTWVSLLRVQIKRLAAPKQRPVMGK
jgi:glycosyltransferase involved in cell wall biosynthesis